MPDYEQHKQWLRERGNQLHGWLARRGAEPERRSATGTTGPATKRVRLSRRHAVGIVHRQNARRSRRRTMATLEKVRVREYMSSRLMTFTPEMEVMNAVHQLVKSGHSGAPVVAASGQLVGTIGRE